MTTPASSHPTLSLDVLFEERKLNIPFSSQKNREFHSSISGGDSSLKRNSSFVKKLKSISRDQLPAILGEAESLKSAKFIDEIIISIFENRWKRSQDVRAAVMGLDAMLALPEKNSGLDQEELSKKIYVQRQFARFALELAVSGIGFDLAQRKYNFPYLCVVENLSKSYPLVLYPIRNVLPSSSSTCDSGFTAFTTEASKWELYEILTKSYIPALSDYACKTHAFLKRLELSQHEYFISKGDLSNYQLEKHSRTSTALAGIMSSLCSFSELFNTIIVPTLEENSSQLTTRLETGQLVPLLSPQSLPELDCSLLIDASSTVSIYSPYGSEEEMKFYKQIPDLKLHVPAGVLYNLSLLKSGTSTPLPSIFEMDENRLDDTSDTKADFSDSIIVSETGISSILEDSNHSGLHSHAQYISFFEKLSRVSSLNEADKLCADFCLINSKAARRRLIQEVMESCKKSPDSLSYLCRLLARMYPYCPGLVSTSLIPSIELEFKTLRRQSLVSGQGPTPASRRRLLGAWMGLLRLIAELCKFSLAPVSLPISCLRVLLAEDVSGLSDIRLSAACAFLENIGQFLYRSLETRDRLQHLVTILDGYKKKVSKDHPLLPLIESAVYQSIPLELRPHPPTLPPVNPINLFLLHLFTKCLSIANRKPSCVVDFVIGKLRKCPWSDAAFCTLFVELIVHKTSSFCFDSLPMVACTLQRFSKYQPQIVKSVLDSLIETLRSGIEGDFVCIPRHQNILSQAMLVGWLLRSCLISSETFAFLLHINPNTSGFLQRITCALLKSCVESGPLKLIPRYSFEKDSSLLLVVEKTILAISEYPVSDDPELNFTKIEVLEELHSYFHSIGRDISIFVKPSLMSPPLSERPSKNYTNKLIDNELPFDVDESKQDLSDEGQEDSFEAEYQNMISCSASANEGPQVNMAVIGGSSLGVSSYSKFPQQQSLRELAVPVIISKPTQLPSSSNRNEVSFTVLSKKKGTSSGKSVLKSLNIPSSEPLVVSTLENISAKEAERSLINTLILESAQKQISGDI